jgi:hypothetical protein
MGTSPRREEVERREFACNTSVQILEQSYSQKDFLS